MSYIDQKPEKEMKDYMDACNVLGNWSFKKNRS